METFASGSNVTEFDWRPKKKIFTENLLLHSAEIWDLLVLTATFLSNHLDAHFQWKALKSR